MVYEVARYELSCYMKCKETERRVLGDGNEEDIILSLHTVFKVT